MLVSACLSVDESYANTLQGWAPLASWFVGWSNFCGFVIGPLSIDYALADMMVTAGSSSCFKRQFIMNPNLFVSGQIAYPSYTPQNWHIYLIILGLLISQGLITMQSTKFIGRFNAVGTIINLIIVIIFLVWFPVGSINSLNSTHDVWTQFPNTTEWPIGWAVILGKFRNCTIQALIDVG